MLTLTQAEYWTLLYGGTDAQLYDKLNKEVSIYQHGDKYIIHYESWGTLKIVNSLDEAKQFKDDYIKDLILRVNDMSMPKGDKVE